MFQCTGNLCGMEHLDLSLQFPDEDDTATFRIRQRTPAAWWFSLAALACMLVAGATVLA